MPDIAVHRRTAQPFGAPEAGDWSLPALGLGAIATSFLEPDPDFAWDEARAAAVREALAAPEPGDPGPPAGPGFTGAA